jgi:hypothetical protein
MLYPIRKNMCLVYKLHGEKDTTPSSSRGMVALSPKRHYHLYTRKTQSILPSLHIYNPYPAYAAYLLYCTCAISTVLQDSPSNIAVMPMFTVNTNVAKDEVPAAFLSEATSELAKALRKPAQVCYKD